MLQARGLSAAGMVPYSAKWLRMIESLLPVLAGEIDDRDYTRLGSSVGLFHAAIDDEREFADMGVDISWHEPVNDLLRRAVEQGYRDQSVTAIIELLRTPGTDV